MPTRGPSTPLALSGVGGPALRNAARTALLVGPLLAFVGVVYVLPFLGVVQWSVTRPEPGLEQYRIALSDPLVQSVFLRTFRIAFWVTLLSVGCAYAVTLLWVRGGPLQRVLVEICILVPFWISLLTRAFGWLALLSNRGIVNGWLEGSGLVSEPLALVRNEFGVIVGITHFLIPFAVFPIAAAMRDVDERVLMAARGMGASRATVFWRVFVPMTGSGILGAAALVFVFAVGFFVTPAILGGGRSVMVAELVYLRIFQSPDWGLGAAISVLLIGAVGAAMAALRRVVGARTGR